MSEERATLADYRHAPRIRRVLRSLVPVICPPDAVELRLEDAIVDHIELSLRSMPPLVRSGLVAGLTAYDLGARAYPKNRGKPAHRLEGERAAAYFRAWRRSPIIFQRELAKGVKGLMCMSCYEMPEMQERIGYRPAGWIAEVTRKRLAVYSDDARRHAESIVAPDPLPGLEPVAGTRAKKEAS